MRKAIVISIVVAAALVMGFHLGSVWMVVQGQNKAGAGFAAIPGEKGGQDIFGPYDIVKDWPKPISGLPGNEEWTWGAGQSVYAENPNRVYLLFRGELPNIKRPDAKLIPDFGPSLIFPIGRLPWRDATVSSL